MNMLEGIVKMISKKKIFWGIISVIYLLLFYAFMYSDILITTSHGINFWDILFDGNISDFYQLCRTDVNNAGYEIYNSADYDFVAYIVFAVWNFPLWVVRELFQVNIWESALAIAWAKSIVLLFTVLLTWCMVRICRLFELGQKKTRQVILLFFTSSLLFSCVFVNAQYDIIYLYFMLEALYCYFNNRMKRFTMFIAMTLPFKPFALFMFAPLLLYKEKNVIKLGLHIIGVLSPWIILKMIGPSGVDDGNLSNYLIMFRHKIEIGNVVMPTYFLFIFIFYFLCYSMPNNQEKRKFYKNSLLIVFSAYVAFFIICGGNPYWPILMVPFGCLLIGLNSSYGFLSVIIETISSVCMIGSYVWRVPWCYDVNIVRSTYVAKIWGNRFDDTNNILDIIHKYIPAVYDLAEERAQGLLFGLFIAGYIVFIIVNIFNDREFALKDRDISNYIFVIRFAIGVVVCMVPLVAYII